MLGALEGRKEAEESGRTYLNLRSIHKKEKVESFRLRSQKERQTPLNPMVASSDIVLYSSI